MYSVTMRLSSREDATKVATWLSGSKIDHRSNFLFVVTGTMQSQAHNGCLIAALISSKILPTLLIIEPTKGA